MKPFLLALLAIPGAAAAQASDTPTGQVLLKAGTPVTLVTTVAISSKTHRQGERIDLTASTDVLADGKIAIPRGSPALAEVTRQVSKSSYGQAGKLEIRLLYVTVRGTRIRIDGEESRDGKSVAVPAVTASVVVSGLIGALISGKDGLIPAGTAITGYVHRDISLAP